MQKKTENLCRWIFKDCTVLVQWLLLSHVGGLLTQGYNPESYATVCRRHFKMVSHSTLEWILPRKYSSYKHIDRWYCHVIDMQVSS